MILQPSGTYQYTDLNGRLINGLEYAFPPDQLDNPVVQTQDINDTFQGIVSLNLQTNDPRIPIHKILTDNLNDGFGIEYVPQSQASILEHQAYVLQSLGQTWDSFNTVDVQSFVYYVQSMGQGLKDLGTTAANAASNIFQDLPLILLVLGLLIVLMYARQLGLY